ncbi:MAG: undecaprenyldiphospho-muramoylpentapeptide beta-N-acetylglucosaminyltransferase [Thermoflavifilum sp.]|nr:undecaprenyldiphospho-muramoylpentapeptide beta-N-acetylglucosaminyltransferase [Thermoflavifilum sp.]
MIIAGGGTGGHVFPAIAIARALQTKQPKVDLLFVGAKGKLEAEKIPQAGYRIELLDMRGVDRGHWWKNWSLPYFMLKSFIQARTILRAFRPHAAIGVGGYASFPILFMAQRMGMDTFIQEQNSFAGKANQWLGKRAVKVFVAYEGMDRFFPTEKIIFTGNPVRQELLQRQLSKSDACASFGLDPQKPVVLVVGGSQGARTINQAILEQAHQLVDRDIQLLWQTGRWDASTIEQRMRSYPQIKVLPFIEDMAKAYAAADIVVSRAGAMAIAELCVMKKPAILVPYPFAAEDHQTHNAQKLVDKQAAWMIADARVKEELVLRIIELSMHPEWQREMSNHIAALAIPDADQRIAQHVWEYVEQKWKLPQPESV